MSAIKPWQDVPRCDCGGPMVTREELDRGEDMPDDHRLGCLSCGESIVGTDAEVEQAKRALAAWEAKHR